MYIEKILSLKYQRSEFRTNDFHIGSLKIKDEWCPEYIKISYTFIFCIVIGRQIKTPYGFYSVETFPLIFYYYFKVYSRPVVDIGLLC